MLKYYALVDTTDNSIKVGPRPWNRKFWIKFLNENNIPIPEFSKYEPEDNSKIIIPNSPYVILIVNIQDPPSMDNFYQQPAGPFYNIGENEINGFYTIAEKPLYMIKHMIKEKATSLRYEKEISGTTVNGIELATDRQSQSLITGVRLKSDQDNSKIFHWKGKNGWVELDRNAVVTISDAVFDHVEACFNKEKDLHAAVDAAETNHPNDFNAIVSELRDIYNSLESEFENL